MKNPNLSVGASGDEVAELHRKLLALGFSISASELDRKFFGPATREVARKCQRESGLKVTGLVDEKTGGRDRSANREAWQSRGSAECGILAGNWRLFGINACEFSTSNHRW